METNPEPLDQPEEVEEFEELDELDASGEESQPDVPAMSVDAFEALPKNEQAAAVRSLAASIKKNARPDDVRRALIAILRVGRLNASSAQALARRLEFVPDSLAGLFFGCCGQSIGLLKERQHKLLLSALSEKLAEGMEVDGYVRVFIAEYFGAKEIPQQVRLRNARRLVKDVLY